jgi:hypothetical protein
MCSREQVSHARKEQSKHSSGTRESGTGHRTGRTCLFAPNTGACKAFIEIRQFLITYWWIKSSADICAYMHRCSTLVPKVAGWLTLMSSCARPPCHYGPHRYAKLQMRGSVVAGSAAVVCHQHQVVLLRAALYCSTAISQLRGSLPNKAALVKTQQQPFIVLEFRSYASGWPATLHTAASRAEKLATAPCCIHSTAVVPELIERFKICVIYDV